MSENPYHVYFYEAFEEEAAALKRFLPPTLNAGFTWQTIQEKGHRTPPAPVISVRTQSHLPTDWAASLKGILTRSTGHDHIIAWQRAIATPVSAGYLPLYCNRAVAEQACLLWMALLRKLPKQISQFSRFHRDGITGRECRGRPITVFGVGNIGSEIVQIAKGLDMDVRGVDLAERHAAVRYVSPHDGIQHGDILVCAMNLTSDNTGYFNYETLKVARPGTLFVNIARGELSPPADLIRLLDEGRLGGVGTDVYTHEKALAVALREGHTDDPDPAVATTLALTARHDVIALPHNAFNTMEAVERKAEQSVEAIVAFETLQHFPNPVP